MDSNHTPTDPPRRVTRRTAIRTIAATTALVAVPLTTRRGAAQQDDDEETQSTTSVRRLSSGGAVVWELDSDNIYKGQTTDGTRTRVAAYADATLMTPEEEPLCDWAGGEDVGTFWEADSGEAVVIVTGNVARMRSSEFRPTYRFRGQFVLRESEDSTSISIAGTAGETNLSTVNALTKALVAIILDGECGLGDQQPTTTTTQ